MSGAEFGYECGVFSLREGSKESMWIDPVQSLSEGRQDYLFFLPSQTLKTFCLLFFPPPAHPGGLFHRNVQHLQRVNRPDRPGGVD